MSSLFGYLLLLVFYKWTAYDAYTSKDAPSLLIHFINMCLFNYNDPTNKPLYRGQVLPPLSTPLPLPASRPSPHALVWLNLAREMFKQSYPSGQQSVSATEQQHWS